MRITGGKVFSEGSFREADVVMEGDRIVAVVAAGDCKETPGEEGETVDAAGCYVVPGLVDVHFHGCMGHDLCDGTNEALQQIADYQASRGVTSICPATMTFSEEKLTRVLSNAARHARVSESGSRLIGINLEGPFISPEKVGAQNPRFVRSPDAEEFARLQSAAEGLIKIVDIAPEEPKALSFAETVAPDALVSLAHTCADYECAKQAFSCGVRHITHLFNAMPGLHHRKPGPIPAAAERSDVTAEIIADGIHVHPGMVRLAFSLFGPSRMVLISDSMRACGLADGTYDLGGQEVSVEGKRATLSDGTLAGSVSDLLTCLQVAVRSMGVPLEHAIAAATENPARAIGLEGKVGSLQEGRFADAAILTPDLELKQVILRGKALL